MTNQKNKRTAILKLAGHLGAIFTMMCWGSSFISTKVLMGDDVVNQTIPLILCSEEDVKGSHGASIGELPQDILFYFASRGIEKEIAEKIISRAKLETLCQGLDEKTADLLQKTIDEVIPT